MYVHFQLLYTAQAAFIDHTTDVPMTVIQMPFLEIDPMILREWSVMLEVLCLWLRGGKWISLAHATSEVEGYPICPHSALSRLSLITTAYIYMYELVCTFRIAAEICFFLLLQLISQCSCSMSCFGVSQWCSPWPTCTGMERNLQMFQSWFRRNCNKYYLIHYFIHFVNIIVVLLNLTNINFIQSSYGYNFVFRPLIGMY